jgi:hypothetical protein
VNRNPIVMRLLLCLLICALPACSSFPELDGTITEADRNAPFPRLVPLTPLIAQADAATQTQITPASIASLEDRIANLQSRANRLRGPVVDAATRANMRRAAARAALR